MFGDGYGKNPPFLVPCCDYSPIDEKERDGEDDLDARPGEVAPVADVGEAEALHQLVQVLHVLPRHRVHVLPPQRVLHDQLVELLYLVPRRERPEGKTENKEPWLLSPILLALQRAAPGDAVFKTQNSTSSRISERSS